MLLQLWQNRRNLLCRQPTERSSKPPEEEDDTGLLLPQLLEAGLVLGYSLGQHHLGDGGWIHDKKSVSEILMVTGEIL